MRTVPGVTHTHFLILTKVLHLKLRKLSYSPWNHSKGAKNDIGVQVELIPSLPTFPAPPPAIAPGISIILPINFPPRPRFILSQLKTKLPKVVVLKVWSQTDFSITWKYRFLDFTSKEATKSDTLVVAPNNLCFNKALQIRLMPMKAWEPFG